MLAFLKNNFITDSREMGQKYKPGIVILWFIAVFVAVQTVISMLTAVPTLVWLFNSDEFMNLIDSLDFEGIMQFTMNMPDWLLIINLFATAAETACAVLFCKFIEKRQLSTMGIVRNNAVKSYIIGYVGGIVLISLSLAVACIGGGMSVEINPDIPIATVILYFLGYLVQGMGEEILCRGFFMTSFARSIKGKGATLTAIMASAALFSLMHVLNSGVTALALLNIFIIGILFAVYILKTGNIWGACAMHSAWNFFQGNIFGVQVSGITSNASVFNAIPVESSVFNGGSFGLEGGLAVTLTVTFALIVLLLLPIGNRGKTN